MKPGGARGGARAAARLLTVVEDRTVSTSTPLGRIRRVRRTASASGRTAVSAGRNSHLRPSELLGPQLCPARPRKTLEERQRQPARVRLRPRQRRPDNAASRTCGYQAADQDRARGRKHLELPVHGDLLLVHQATVDSFPIHAANGPDLQTTSRRHRGPGTRPRRCTSAGGAWPTYRAGNGSLLRAGAGVKRRWTEA